MYTHICIYTYTYISIYREREREREIDKYNVETVYSYIMYLMILSGYTGCPMKDTRAKHMRTEHNNV